MTIIETENNASNGYFLDKPDLDVFVAGGQSGCAHSVGVTYTTFNGLSKDGKVQTKVNFAKQTFDGTSTFSAFSAQKVSDNWGQGQGTALAVDPTDGNNLYVFFSISSARTRSS